MGREQIAKTAPAQKAAPSVPVLVFLVTEFAPLVPVSVLPMLTPVLVPVLFRRLGVFVRMAVSMFVFVAVQVFVLVRMFGLPVRMLVGMGVTMPVFMTMLVLVLTFHIKPPEIILVLLSELGRPGHGVNIFPLFSRQRNFAAGASKKA